MKRDIFEVYEEELFKEHEIDFGLVSLSFDETSKQAMRHEADSQDREEFVDIIVGQIREKTSLSESDIETFETEIYGMIQADDKSEFLSHLVELKHSAIFTVMEFHKNIIEDTMENEKHIEHHDLMMNMVYRGTRDDC